MSRITLEYAQNDFIKLKKYAHLAYNKNQIEDSFKFISAASALAYHLNFCFYDDELESLLQQISQKLISEKNIEPIKNRVVFYDFFGIDNQGLTQQYLTALLELGYEILYILSNDNGTRSQDIICQVQKSHTSEVLILGDNFTCTEKINCISQKVSEFRPEKAFLHMSPWDVVGVATFNGFKTIKRYQINLTDHAFWLGKNCLDYNIEFREYGQYISEHFRNIPKDKILLLKYYPILNNHDFQGFPVDTKNKVVILSGGAFYKIYSDDNLYFNILKRIVQENENVVVFYAGAGNSTHFEDFIKKHNFSDRIFFLGHRKDINKLFAKSDIYLGTYPFLGGLMSQYALANGKIPLGFTEKDMPWNYIEGVFEMEEEEKLTYFNLDDFHMEINQMIRSESYRIEKAKRLRSCIPTPGKFTQNLNELLEKHSHDDTQVFDFNHEKFASLYFSIENKYLKIYHLIKMSHLKLTYFRYNVFDALYSSWNLMVNQRKLLYLKITNKLKIKQ